MDLEKADSLVSFRQLATLVDRVSFTTDYLLARLPSLLHHTVRDAVTGEACSPITLSDYSAHLHPKMGAGHGSASSSSSASSSFSSRSAAAAARVPCPQRATSFVGVNQRNEKDDEHEPGRTNAVSLRLFSAAMRFRVSSLRGSSSTLGRRSTAAGLPPRGDDANESI